MLEHAELRALLPQRFPMLLLDRVTEVEPGVRLTAVKAVTGCEPCYRGLSDTAPPSAYRYPPSLLLESFGQAAAVLWFLQHPELEDGEDRLPLFTSVRDLRFGDPVLPGDLVRHEVRMDHAVPGAAFVTGETRVGGRCVATVGSLMAAVRPRSELGPARASGMEPKGDTDSE